MWGSDDNVVTKFQSASTARVVSADDIATNNGATGIAAIHQFIAAIATFFNLKVFSRHIEWLANIFNIQIIIGSTDNLASLTGLRRGLSQMRTGFTAYSERNLIEPELIAIDRQTRRWRT